MAGTTTTSVVGAGKLARSLLPLLRGKGYPVRWVYARRRSQAIKAARLARGARATTSLARALGDTSLVLLTVSDASLEAVASRIASLGVELAGQTFLHHSGASGLECLRPLAEAGAAVGSLHPLQALGTPALAGRTIPGSSALVDGDRRGRRVALRLARDLGLKALPLEGLDHRERLAYHTAASLVSNDLVALFDLALELMEQTGLKRDRALGALLALLRGTAEQIEAGGPEGAISGPAARGDTSTLRLQLQRLSLQGTAAREIHRLLSERMARLALEHGQQGAKRTFGLLAGRGKGAGV